MRTALLVTALLVVSGFAIAGGSEETTTWRTIADEPLIQAYDEGQDPLTIIVQGPKVPAPVVEPTDRDAWRAHWDAHSKAFLGDLEERATSLGGSVGTKVPAVNAAFLTISHDRLPALLDSPQIQLAGLDWYGAV